jgi:predicted small metal-binding protein
MSLEFRCSSVGVTDCKAATKADTADELLALVAAHARDVHGVELNQTLINYALTTVEEKE